MDSNISTHKRPEVATDFTGPAPAFSGPTVVLHRPQIPQNTGSISRLCVAIQSTLIITGRAGFQIDDAKARRAGLDHWKHLDLRQFSRYKDFHTEFSGRRVVAVTKSASTSAFEFLFEPEDILLFGNETMGLPPALLKRIANSVNLPMTGKVRSLNLSNTVSVVAYEYIRQVFGIRARHAPEAYPRTYYRSPQRPTP